MDSASEPRQGFNIAGYAARPTAGYAACPTASHPAGTTAIESAVAWYRLRFSQLAKQRLKIGTAGRQATA